jgi:hypothetical protein
MGERILIELDPPDTVRITGIKINLVCRRCANAWGVYLREDYLLAPEQCNCRECQAALIRQNGVNNRGHTT